MKKNFLPYMALMALSCVAGFANEGKPKVALCQAPDCVVAENPASQALQDTRKKLSDMTHDDAVVMKNFDTLSEILLTAYQKEKSMTAQEIQEICRGIDFAAEKHRLQTRKNAAKTPYISHPLAVTINLMSIGEVRETVTIIGSLLHDTLEDTPTTFEELESKFNKQIATLVLEVSDDKSVAKETRSRMQVINASHKSKAAAQILLADNLFNLNDLFTNTPSDWSQARVDRYYEWVQSVIDRLPQANNNLHHASQEVINKYWEKQEALVAKK